MATKLQKILNDTNLTQGDFILKIQSKYGIVFTRSYISKICSGNITNYTVKTALILSDTLGVNLDDIIDAKSRKIMVKETIEKATAKEELNAIKREEKERLKEEKKQLRKAERKIEQDRKMKEEQNRKIEQRKQKEEIARKAEKREVLRKQKQLEKKMEKKSIENKNIK